VSYYNRQDDVIVAQTALAAELTETHIAEPNAFKFSRNWRRVRSSIVHFQLRNLLWATSPNSLYYISDNRVLFWNSLSRRPPYEIMDVSGVVSSAIAPGLGQLSLCTLCVKEELIAAGGFGGELIARRVGSDQEFAARYATNNHCTL